MASGTSSSSEAPATVLSLLIVWANEQDRWIRALAAEIIAWAKLSAAREEYLK